MPFIKPYRHERHHFIKLISWSVIIVTNKKVNKYGTTRANISRVTNKGVMMCFKAVTSNFLTLVGRFVEPSTAIENPKRFLEANISIRKSPIKLTSSNMAISPSLYSFFFFSFMLRSNSRSHQIIG